MFLSSIIDALFVDKYHGNIDKSRFVVVASYGGNYYLKKGLKQVKEFLRDSNWDYRVKVLELTREPDNIEDYVEILAIPHSKSDKTFYYHKPNKNV